MLLSHYCHRAASVCSRRLRQSAVMVALLSLPVLAVDTTFTGGGDGTTWVDDANWSGGQPNNATFDAFINAGGAWNVSLGASRTINNLTIGGDDLLTILNSIELTLNGDLFNGGVITVAAGANQTALRINDGILSGLGRIVLSGVNAQLTGSGTVTNSAGHTIEGQGTIGQNAFSLVNAGLIDANVTGAALLIDPANTVTGVTNTGTLRASNGGFLQFTGSNFGAFTNTGGTIEAVGAGSEVQLFNSANISGGTLATSDGGIIRAAAGQTIFLSNLTLSGAFAGSNNSTTVISGTITNNGTLTLEAGANPTELSVSGNTLLAGNGTLFLSSTGAASNARVTGNSTLTNDTGHTIAGEGNLGNNVVSIINNGLISANVNGRTLLVDPANTVTGMTNAGTMRASNSGILQLTGSNFGAFHNAGGTIEATGAGSEVQLVNSANIDGGTLATADGGVIRAVAGQTITLADLINAGTYIGDNNSNTIISGTIVNNGSITIRAGLNLTDLTINGNTTLAGTGTVVLNSTTAASNARVNGNSTLTHDAEHTIAGEGNLGSNAVSIINNGLVDANVADRALLVDPANTGTGFTNTGTLRASNGGILQLSGSNFGAFHNANGDIEAIGAGSEVQLVNSVEIDGGVLSTDEGGVIRNGAGQNATLRTLTNAGTFIADNNSTTRIGGTINNTSTMTIAAGANLTDLTVIDGAATLTGGGSVTLSGTNARIAGGGTLTNAADHTIEGEGNLGSNAVSIVNQGMIHANVPGATLTVDPANTETGLTNTGTMRASDGGILQLTGSNFGGFHNAGGLIEAVGAGSEVRLHNSAVIDGGILGTTDGGIVRNNAAQTTTLVDLTNTGTFIADNASNTNISGTITNNGTMTMAAGGNLTDLVVTGGAATLAGTGRVVLSGGNARITGSGMLTNETGHTIEGQGNLGANAVAIVNKGLIEANVAGSILTVDPANNDTGMTNQSTMRASDGGIMLLTGSNFGGFHNAGGVIEAVGAGSEVQLTIGAAIDGGTLATADGGVVRVNGGQTITLANLTNTGTFIADNASNTNITGTITNDGTMTIAAGGNLTDMNVTGGAATLAGTGRVTLSGANARVAGSGTLTNAAGHTIQGQGNLGANSIAIVNDGLIDANVNGAGLTIDPSNGGNLVNNGILEASDGGILNLSGANFGNFTNNGTFQALDGSTIQTITNGNVTNVAGGNLTGGTYRSVSTGNASSVALNGPGISTIAAETTVELSGAAATMTFGGTALQASLATNNGTLKIHDGHNFNMTNALANNGLVSLGGAGLTGATLNSGGAITNSATGEIAGHGTIEDTILNSGLVRAVDGTLTMHGRIDGQSGTIQIDPGAGLDLSPAGGDSDADFLTHNGAVLNLGLNNVSVRKDYTNAGFGVGNSFDARANVVGSGLILAEQPIAQTLSGDVANGASAAVTMDLGNIRVGDSVTKSYAVNSAGTPGPTLRGALQTANAVNGGNITDARLSGSGVTAQNFSPLANNAGTGSFDVTFTGTSAGPLTGQQVAVVNNFDNVDNQTLGFGGAAYNPAVASVTSSINLGNFHVGDVIPGQAIQIGNTAPAGLFSEDLRASNITAHPDAALVGGSPISVDVIAGGSNSQVNVTMASGVAGQRTGTVTMDLFSNATVGGAPIAGLNPLALGQATVDVSATVYRLGAPAVSTPVDLGEFHVGDVALGNLTVGNMAVNDGFSESLRAAVSGFGPDVIAAAGTTDIVPGGNSGAALSAQLSTATAGIRSGLVNIKLDSLAAAAGLGDTDLGVQNAMVTAKVFNLAGATVNNTQPIDFGIVHVGDVVTPAGLSISNSAPGGGFSENLNATFGAVGSGLTTNGGSIALLAALASDQSSMSVGLDTSTNRSINGSVAIDFESDGTGVNSLGKTMLGMQLVNIIGQVNEYANPAFDLTGGDGTLVADSETVYSLDLGTVVLNDSSPLAMLRLLNDVLGPADSLTGQYVVSASGFILGGFNPFVGLAPDDSIAGLEIALDTSSVGVFNGAITLKPLSENASGFSGALPDVVINLTGEVVVPEPTTLALLALSAGLIRRRRRA